MSKNTDKELLSKHNFWQEKKFELGFLRDSYLKFLQASLDTKLIKVLSGQRRVGKSYVLKQFIHLLIEEEEIHPRNILYINFELNDFSEFRNKKSFLRLFELYLSTIREDQNKKIYLFLDEVQELAEWEKILSSFLADDNLQIEMFITGSNSSLLNSELATYIAGRYISKDIYPFSYTEFLGYHSLIKSKNTLIQFLKGSQLPEFYKLQNQELQYSFINNIRDSIIYKDIIHRYQIHNFDLIEKLFLFLLDNIGSLFSLNSVSKKLKAGGLSSSTTTIGDYLKYLEASFVISAADRFDIKGKRILEGEKKYYLNDLGFKNFLFSGFDQGQGKLLENFVYNALRQAGFQVYVGKLANKEVDFIAQRQDKQIYVQVAYILADESVLEREYSSLEMIDNHWRKIVVTLDDLKLKSRNGIEHIQAWELACFLDCF